MAYPYIVQGDNITVVIDNKPHTINRTHVVYQRVLDAIKSNDWDTVKDNIEPKSAILNYGSGFVQILDNVVYWHDKPMHNALTNRMVQMLSDGFTIDPLVYFMNNLMDNPSRNAVEELYGFLEKNNLPITPDGYFLAYKKVRDDYKDVYSGTMDNSVGQVVEIPRNQVDDNRDNVCSSGLHFCSHEYLKSFSGDRVVILKINPRDVVSIPTDYNNSKGRTCRYEVIGEVEVSPNDSAEFNKPVQTNANNNIRPIKFGSSEFYRGYTDGFYGEGFDPHDDYKNYSEGFQKGQRDEELDNDERYRYVI